MYVLRLTIEKNMSSNIMKEIEICIVRCNFEPAVNSSVKIEAGYEEFFKEIGEVVMVLRELGTGFGISTVLVVLVIVFARFKNSATRELHIYY